MISAVVVSLNEEKHLKECLETIKGKVDEIVMIDLKSSDGSIEVAKRFGVKVFSHNRVDYVELVRNFAISKAEGEWILILDPDERMNENLLDQLKKIVSEDRYIAVNISRKNIFFGKWVKHSNWWPDKQIRFFKKDKVKWSEKIHSYPKVEGDILNLPAKAELALTHFGYDSIKEFLERQNRYSTVESTDIYKSGERFSWEKFIWKPFREFLVRYIKHLGFLDGFYGFALTTLMMIYQIAILVKLWELERNKK